MMIVRCRSGVTLGRILFMMVGLGLLIAFTFLVLRADSRVKARSRRASELKSFVVALRVYREAYPPDHGMPGAGHETSLVVFLNGDPRDG